MTSKVPQIDFTPFLEGSEQGKRHVATQIGSACRTIGFFTLVNHGVSQDLIDRVFSANREFHQLPLEEKEEILISRSEHHRGYHPFSAEATDPNAKPDLKEAFDMALDLPPEDPDVQAGKPFHGPNVWPRNPAGFQDTLEEYYGALLNLGESICRCFALDLGLEEGYFADKHSKPLAQLRLLHYPELDISAFPDQQGAGAHTDYGSVAILTQDSVGGLELRNRSGEWIPVEPVPGAFICNVGHIMEIWTNGLYPSTWHRVVNNGKDRYSQVLFYDPNFDCLVAPLDCCVSPERPAAYVPITMGRYLEETFDKTFVYRKSPESAS
ncbi:MAG: isopenicillin N synthase family dioxygenase [bacterium]